MYLTYVIRDNIILDVLKGVLDFLRLEPIHWERPHSPILCQRRDDYICNYWSDCNKKAPEGASIDKI